jgi:hypothetical protein
VLRLPELIPGAAHTVCDCIHSYVQFCDDQNEPLDVDDFQIMTKPLEKYDINPEHCTFFLQKVQTFEKLLSESTSMNCSLLSSAIVSLSLSAEAFVTIIGIAARFRGRKSLQDVPAEA